MSEACCLEPSHESEAGLCPVSRSVGQPVKWTTVAALTLGPVPSRQEFYLCSDTDCDVVYFGDQGSQLRRTEVHPAPGFKAGSTDLICYCFLHTRAHISQEVVETGASPTLESIRTKVREKGCACEVRNPAGKCCLRDIGRLIESITKKRS